MKAFWLSLAIIASAFALNISLFQQMPQQVASHWNINGEADGYMDKTVGLLMLPAISLILLVVFVLIPIVDPLAKNIKEFMKYYEGLIIMFSLFMFYINLLVVYWNLVAKFNMIQAMIPGFAALFYYMGVLISHAKTNWSIGIRTPWTMSSTVVWEKTHKLGGLLFKACGIASLAGLLLPDLAFFFVLLPVLGISVFLFAYSYLEFRKTA